MPIQKTGEHIIFLCTGNRTRSPLAAAVFDEKMRARGYHCKVESAGTILGIAGMRASSVWFQLDETRNYDLSRHRSKHYSSLEITKQTYVVCLEWGSDEEIKRLSCVDPAKVVPLYVLDPSGSPFLRAYEESFRQIDKRTDELMEKLIGT